MKKEQLDVILHEILSIFHPEEYEITNTGINVQCTIHYPEIIISNSEDIEHTIRDLFFRMEFGINQNKNVYLQNFYILRSTYEEKEVFNNYVFSHCNNNNLLQWSNSLCLGYGTPLSDLKTLMCDTSEVTADNLEQLIILIDNYLSWESLEGGPYKSIKNLFNINSDTRRIVVKSAIERCFNDYYIHLENKLLITDFNWEVQYNTIRFVLKNEQEVMKRITSYDAFCSNGMIIDYINNEEYYKLGNTGVSNIKSLQNRKVITFRDKEYISKIILNEKEKEETKPETRFFSAFREYINSRKTAEFYSKIYSDRKDNSKQEGKIVTF